MSYIIEILNLICMLVFGSLVILGISFHFQGEWANEIKKYLPFIKRIIWSFPLCIVLFILLKNEYPWAELEGHKKFYFSTTFLIIRNIIYIIGIFASSYHIQRYPSLALILFFFISNFFAFDWGMSLEAEWFSNMYGLTYLANGTLGAMGMLMIKDFNNLKKEVKKDYIHLFLVCSITWFYIQFCQFIIIWMGNIPRESIYYLRRWEVFGGWPVFIIIFLKLIPLAVISISEKLKTNNLVAKIVIFPIAICCIGEAFWIVGGK
ncbi:MAG: hypothetical protein AB7I27_13515 [Bacteriovoracaceae bacterium]